MPIAEDATLLVVQDVVLNKLGLLFYDARLPQDAGLRFSMGNMGPTLLDVGITLLSLNAGLTLMDVSLALLRRNAGLRHCAVLMSDASLRHIAPLGLLSVRGRKYCKPRV